MDANEHEAPPLRCERLATLVARGGGTWTERVPSGELEYPLPAHAESEVLEYLRPLARVAVPAQGLARLPAGRVFGPGVVLSADGMALARDVSADFGKPFAEHWLLGQAKLRAPTVLAGTVAVAALNHGGGYCHWLLEELPRLLTLTEGAADHVIAHAAGRFAREAWAWRCGPENLVEARRASHFTASPLLVPGLVAEAGAPTPESLRRVREFVESREAEAATGGGGRGEKIYISRAKAGRRRVGNEEELGAELEERGFARVFFEELGWAEQIAVCRAARVLVAPHGAGLANLVFCAPGTRVVELVNRAYFNPVFWRLAALGGLDYRPVVSTGDGEIGENHTRNRDDIPADVARVRAALRH